ncbi:uncharacterized protein TRAVEDRAFT_43981 [Trametes versicolor FP-101664 SS1]|uniref:uncharacterized protein n=1 Tax=Trametes versicolor (strain FP-101664) TaxID=717944 RepID=UPI0004623A85|nr:uncharacterized protein TRAVEDRAFT_43981 [Trametes versicolor FP-101664 SS1]EIW61156.1 hypothetical protein TRAVEDRAFT_43981 [Trametes versicolor FP-101664 SS1]
MAGYETSIVQLKTRSIRKVPRRWTKRVESAPPCGKNDDGSRYARLARTGEMRDGAWSTSAWYGRRLAANVIWAAMRGDNSHSDAKSFIPTHTKNFVRTNTSPSQYTTRFETPCSARCGPVQEVVGTTLHRANRTTSRRKCRAPAAPMAEEVRREQGAAQRALRERARGTDGSMAYRTLWLCPQPPVPALDVDARWAVSSVLNSKRPTQLRCVPRASPGPNIDDPRLP